MSSPLSFFRKYQRSMMIVFGVLLMVSFLIVPVLLDSMGNQSGGGGADDEDSEVVVSWKGNSLTGHELRNIMTSQNQMVNFLGSLEQVAQSRDKDAVSQAPRFPRMSHEQGAVQTLMLAQRAEEIGLVVDDDALYDHLMKSCPGFIVDRETAPTELKAQFSHYINNQMSFTTMMDSLRTELLALKLRQLSQSGLTNVPPALAFEHHNRLHRTVKIDTLPVKIEDFLDKVEASPTEKQLKDLFEDGKKRFPTGDLSKPGFRQPQRVGVQYLKAELAPFIEEAMAEVTDEQIKADREETARKKEEAKKELEKVDKDAKEGDDKESDTDTEKEGEDKTDGEESDKAEKTDDDKKDDADADGDKDDDSTSDEKDTKEGEEESDDGTTDDEKSDDDSADGEESDGEKSDDEEEEESDEDIRRRLAHKPATEKMKAAILAAQAELDDLNMSVKYIDWKIKPKSEDDEDADEERFDIANALRGSEDDPPFDFEKLAKKHGLTLGEIEPQSGSELQDQDIASAEEFDVDSGTTKRFMQMVFSESMPYTPQTIISIPDDYLFWKTELIKDYVPDLGKRPLAEQAKQFDGDLVLRDLGYRFENRLGKDDKWLESGDGTEYFVIPTKDGKKCEVYKWDGKKKKSKSELIATLDRVFYDDTNLIEILNTLYKSWRLQQAKELALEFANEKAEKVRKAEGKTLKEALGEDGENVPDEASEFRWLTQGGSAGGGFGGMPFMSQVPNVENPSPDFMKAAYELRNDEVGVAINHSNDIFYVIKCVDDGRSADLQDRFVSSKAFMSRFTRAQLQRFFPPYGIPPNEFPTQAEIGLLQREWMEELEEDMGLEWVREAESLR